MDFKIVLSTISLLLFISACSENLLDEFAKKDTYRALVFEARKELNARNYAAASTLFETAGGATGSALERSDQADYASSYSGQCGLEFITLVEGLADTTGSTLLGILMGAFPNSTATIYGHCITAESRMDDNIGAYTVMTGDENLLMTFNSFAKIGSILNTVADSADNNGVFDPGFDHCDSGDISDLEVSHIGSALARVVTSLGQVGGNYADIDDISAFCALPAAAAICTKTDESTFNAAEINALRHLIGSNDYGIGSCGDTFNNCFNPVGCP